LIGLYDHGGRLLVNDVPTQYFYDGQLHRRTTACFQEYSKHFLSLRDNVALGRTTSDKAGDSRIVEALSRAEGKSILDKLDLDTVLNPHGVGSEALSEELQQEQDEMNKRMMGSNVKSLSLGQWQKVSLARGFVASEQADLVVFE
jgi:ABC-type multidrug transport system fused ATPase/permease subunit